MAQINDKMKINLSKGQQNKETPASKTATVYPTIKLIFSYNLIKLTLKEVTFLIIFSIIHKF